MWQAQWNTETNCEDHCDLLPKVIAKPAPHRKLDWIRAEDVFATRCRTGHSYTKAYIHLKFEDTQDPICRRCQCYPEHNLIDRQNPRYMSTRAEITQSLSDPRTVADVLEQEALLDEQADKICELVNVLRPNFKI